MLSSKDSSICFKISDNLASYRLININCVGYSYCLVISSGITGSINQAVNAIANSSNEIIATNSQQISLTATQQATAIQQVVEAMNNLNQGAIQSASGISQIKVGTQKLNEAALNLQAVV